MTKFRFSGLLKIAVFLSAAAFLLTGCSSEKIPEEPDVTEAVMQVVTETPVPATTVQSTPTARLMIDPNVGASPTPSPTAPEISIPGWGGIRIPAGVTEADASLYNPQDNDGWYYLTFELLLKDTGEVVFSTGLIPPGMYCNKVTLNRAYEAGTYKCIMHVQPYRMNEELTPTNNADFDTELIVTAQ